MMQAKLIAYALGGLALLSLAGWVGYRWQKGEQAIAQAEQQAQQIDALRASLTRSIEQLERDRKAYRDAIAEANALTESFAAITSSLAYESQKTAQQFRQIRADLRQAFSARPELVDIRVGPDILRAWREANAGTAADAAAVGTAAADSGASAERLPGPAAADRRQPAGANQ